MKKANTRGTAGETGVVVALEPVSKIAADITDGRALGGNLRLIRSPRQCLLARANVVDQMSGSAPPPRGRYPEAWAAVRSLLPLPVALKASPAARQLSLPPPFRCSHETAIEL